VFECVDVDATNLADLGTKLDVLLRTALDLLLGRHVGCELVIDLTGRVRDAVASRRRTFGARGFRLCAGKHSADVSAPRHVLNFSSAGASDFLVLHRSSWAELFHLTHA
jgi:hypothetical protein